MSLCIRQLCYQDSDRGEKYRVFCSAHQACSLYLLEHTVTGAVFRTVIKTCYIMGCQSMLQGQALKLVMFKQSNSVTNCYVYGERVMHSVHFI